MIKFTPIDKAKDEKGNEQSVLSASADGQLLPVRVRIDPDDCEFILDAVTPSWTGRLASVPIFDDNSRAQLEAKILNHMEAKLLVNGMPTSLVHFLVDSDSDTCQRVLALKPGQRMTLNADTSVERAT